MKHLNGLAESESKRGARLPGLLAIAFGLVATSTTVTFAALEGRLLSAENGVQPFIWNVSTIADFVLLNPLIIYSFGLSIRAMLTLRVQLPIRRLAVLGAILAFVSMFGYIQSFSKVRFFDAISIGPGIKEITLTGWTTLTWTWLALSFVYFSVVSQLYYIRHVWRLADSDIAYEPLHADECGGYHRYALPSWYFINGMVAGLLVFIGFYVQDRLVNHLQDSNRLAYLTVYIVLAPSLFLPPVLHLRRLMRTSKRKMISNVQQKFDLAFNDWKKTCSEPNALKELIELRKNISGFPEWPLPIAQLFGSLVYWVGPLMPVLNSLANLVGKQLKP